MARYLLRHLLLDGQVLLLLELGALGSLKRLVLLCRLLLDGQVLLLLEPAARGVGTHHVSRRVCVSPPLGPFVSPPLGLFAPLLRTP